jgi:ribosome-associated protein YbcJ (S4-like RNA binding protein)
MILGGEVQVDGRPEDRRSAKIRAGQVVTVGPEVVRVRSGGAATP